MKVIKAASLFVIILPSFLFPQNLDSLKIKSEADSLITVGDSLGQIQQFDKALKLYKNALYKYQHIGDKGNEANVFNRLGIVSSDIQNNIKALSYYEDGLIIYQAIGDLKGQGKILYNIGHIYRESADFDKAIDYYEKCNKLKKILGDSKGIALNLFHIALSHKENSNYPKALENYQSCLRMYQELGNLEQEAWLLLDIGRVHISLSNYQETLQCYVSSLKIWEELGNQKMESELLFSIGRLYYFLGDFDKAIEFFKTCLDIYNILGDKKGQALSYYNLGGNYRQLYKFPEALEHYTTALEIQRETGDRLVELGILNDMAIVYRNISNYTKALDYYKLCLRIIRSLDGYNRYEATILMNIGVVYLDLFNYAKSLEYFELSLKISKNFGDEELELSNLQNLGNTYYYLSEFDEALEYYEASIELDKRIGNSLNRASLLVNKGNVYRGLKNYTKALECYETGLVIHRELGQRLEEGRALGNLGQMYDLLGDSPKAIKYLEMSLDIATDLGQKPKELISLKMIGDFYYYQNLDTLAIKYFDKVIMLTENIRGSLNVESFKSRFVSGNIDAYEKMISSLLRLGRTKETFNYVERSKARSFLDLLASGEVKVGKNKHKEFLQREKEFHKIEEELMATEEDTVLYASLQGKLEDQRDLIALEMGEKKEYEPELASMVTVNSLKLQEVQALIDEKTTVLEYFLNDDMILIWLITKDEAGVHQKVMRRDSLKVMAKVFRNAIMFRSKTEELSKGLYNILVAPVETMIKTEKIVIIPHGILHYLPFHALQDQSGTYLVEQYDISYLPSASVMKYLISKKRKKGRNLLAFGNPKLGNLDYASLPFAEKEVQAVSRQYHHSKILTKADATEDSFRELAPDYDILHLACHAELQSAYPLFSGLKLAPGEKHDGELDIHEIFTMDLNAYMVVLSACQTGLGHLTDGDELVGLSRAFIYAGTPSVLSSLWMVEDESTSFLMERFYAHLKKNDKAKSLRMAQLESLKQYEHPYYWAPFVLIGDSE